MISTAVFISHKNLISKVINLLLMSKPFAWSGRVVDEVDVVDGLPPGHSYVGLPTS